MRRARSRISYQDAVMAELAGDHETVKAYERQGSSLLEPPPIMLAPHEVNNPPAWAKGHMVTDGQKTWIA